MKVSEDQLERIKEISTRNLILFHGEDFAAIYNGASVYKMLSKGVRDKAIRNGLLTKHHHPSKQRLTSKAIEIMKDHNLI